MKTAGETLEEAGASIMKRKSVSEVGIKLGECGQALEVLALQIKELAPEQENAIISSQRMTYAAEKMIEAGNELQGSTKPKPNGKGWLKDR